MIFGRNEIKSTLKSESTIIKSTNSPDNILTESFSLYEYGLQCMRETDNIIREYLKESYISAGYNINEAFVEDYVKDKFNWKKLVDIIIGGFIKAIKSLFNTFKAIVVKFLYSDTTITKYKNVLLNYTDSIDVNFDYVNYTNLGTATPNPLLYLRFSEDYELLQEDLSKLAKINSKEKFIAKVNGMRDDVNFSIKNDEYYNNTRLEILNSLGYNKYTEYASESEYPNGLYLAFRNGVGSPLTSVKTLDFNAVRESTERLLEAKKVIQDIEKTTAQLENVAKKTCNKITGIRLDSVNKSFGQDHEIEFALSNLLKTKSSQLKTKSDFYVLAFNAKLQAVKDALVQDKKICYEAIADYIQKGGTV